MTRAHKKRLAIIGAGSSGLVTLKYALDLLPDWEVTCFEKGNDVRGSWGFPYQGFVSTSTKFATQFACYPKFSAICEGSQESPKDFFMNGEYGDYLEEFAENFGLKAYIRFHISVKGLVKSESNWQIMLQNDQSETSTETFDAVFVCTGLANRSKLIHTTLPTLRKVEHPETIQNQKIVIVGGGESAVDTASRLADPALKNQVWLSLRSGIRVSPRYHPIRGVPSDYLRNRLLLSISPQFRNALGGFFVRIRVKYEDLFQKSFARKHTSKKKRGNRSKDWNLKLMRHARGKLFNVFHTKSDTFLDYVDSGRIQIVGPSKDHTFDEFKAFGSEGPDIKIGPNLVVDQTGYKSALDEITESRIDVSHFYRGCIHSTYPFIFLIGFARPVIGNIPSIAEIQAQYALSVLSGVISRTSNIKQKHQEERRQIEMRFPHLTINKLLPVEMFPYCDAIARDMGRYPTIRSTGSIRNWIRLHLAPASTLHYASEIKPENQMCYLPKVLCLVLFLIRCTDLVNSWISSVKKKKI